MSYVVEVGLGLTQAVTLGREKNCNDQRIEFGHNKFD
jgi:hypothetical protein